MVEIVIQTFVLQNHFFLSYIFILLSEQISLKRANALQIYPFQLSLCHTNQVDESMTGSQLFQIVPSDLWLTEY